MRWVPLTIALLVSLGLGAAQKTEDVCPAANRALALGRLEEARGRYEDCLKQGPIRFDTLSNLGTVYAQLSKYDLAIQAYQQALALDPENAPVRMNLGLAYLKAGHPADAAKEFERSLLDGAENPKTEELLALCHYQTKEYSLAALEASRAHDALPEESSAAFLLGSSYLKMGLYKQAIPHLYFAAQKTDTAETHMFLGEAFLGVKAYKEALREFLRSSALAPQTPGLHSDLGTAYAGLSRVKDALAEYQKELARDPSDFEATYYLGRLKRLSGEVEDSKRLLAKAEQMRPGDPAVEYEYAVFAMNDKDYPKAEQLLTGILEKLPDYADAHVLLAEVYFKMRRREDGNRQKAIVEALKQADQERTTAEGKAREKQAGGGSRSAPHP